MDAFSPDFVPHWNAPGLGLDERHDDADERRGARDEEALAELAERILAARSVV